MDGAKGMTDYLLCVLIVLFAVWINYWTTRNEVVAAPQQTPVIILVSLLAGGILYVLLGLAGWLIDKVVYAGKIMMLG